MPRPQRLIKLKCGFCNKEIVRPFHRANVKTRTGKTMVCDKKCRGKLAGFINSKRKKYPQEGFQKGHKLQVREKHWAWKGGIRIDYERIRKSSEWSEWRNKVFTRDEYTCKKCFRIGYTLHPHHIKNSAQHINERFNLDNGITLCKECHSNFHSKYGTRSNTKKQIEEFLVL